MTNGEKSETIDVQKVIKSAITCLENGKLQEAEYMLRDILKVQPHNVSALHFMGMIFYQRKDHHIAIDYIRKALHFAPDYVDAYNNLGIVLQEIGDLDSAISCYQMAIKLNPNFVRAYHNVGTALKEKWQIDDAIMNYKRALQLDPNFAEAYNSLGDAFQDQGKLTEAEKCYRHALKIKPMHTYFHNLLLMMNYDSRYDTRTVLAEHRKFAEQYEKPLYPLHVSHKKSKNISKRLKIGYVSPDFRKHSVAYFIEPVLASHNRRQFEIFCYSDVLKEDEVTERMQRHADHWQRIAGISDEEVYHFIREHGIDILVDLAGHTANNRLLVFARKPSPVQVSWIGYPATTGLSTIDYKIVDAYTDPPGLTDTFYTEKLLRLPDSFFCYRPDDDSPIVGDLPALKSAHVTFGSFNYFSKVSEETADVWATILKALPDSRLVMKARNFADKTARRCAIDMFVGRGIAVERIEMMPMKSSFREHLDTYNSIDIALDTFPYNGTTTTCEALWMGVPVVTLSGKTHASRVGTSILSNIGLTDFIAHTPEEYIETAVDTARNISALKQLRESLRKKMAHSALCNKESFAINLEHAYRRIWIAWCKAH
jgi:protein O-GlcNAc transferase